MEPKELLWFLSEDNVLLPGEFDAFLQANQGEGQYHDYKDGKLLNDKEKAKKVVREYVSAFANSDGGVLILGISNDSPRQISGCRRVGNAEPSKWAEEVLHPMAPFFEAAPRFLPIPHDKGDLLLISVEPNLSQYVPCITRGAWTFHFRFNESTMEVPEWLGRDLFQGRRRRSALDLSLKTTNAMYQGEFCRVVFSFDSENIGYSSANNVLLGCVWWSSFNDNSSIRPRASLNHSLKSHLRIEPQDENNWQLLFYKTELGKIRPFESKNSSIDQSILAGDRRHTFDPMPLGVFQAAFFLSSEDGPPTWYGLEYSIAVFPVCHHKRPKVEVRAPLRRLSSERPIVSVAPPE